jgi:transglutaminase-like putative cysteine protease
MLFRIRHSLHYRYDQPVFLEPLTVRLTPRQDSSQSLLHHSLEVEAAPNGRSSGLDADGNASQVLWFDDLRERLDLVVTMEVETLLENPFDWIITDPAVASLPACYDAATSLSLAPFLIRESVDSAVAAWAAELAAGVGQATAPFLMALADRIHHSFHHVGRPDGDPIEPAETLAGRSGACRDTAMLYVAACRSQGLAARFVSGYSMHHPPEVTEQELHAWAEVYLPGAGWRAYDPSLGLAVADGHVALAAAPDHRLAAPVSGSYRGTGVGSAMDYRVALQAGSR